MKDLQDIDYLYTRVLTVGFTLLRKALDSGNVEWAKAEAEFLHNIPSLIGERRWPRHDYFIDSEWKMYVEWVSAPGREMYKTEMQTFYNDFMQDIAALVALKKTMLPHNEGK